MNSENSDPARRAGRNRRPDSERSREVLALKQQSEASRAKMMEESARMEEKMRELRAKVRAVVDGLTQIGSPARRTAKQKDSEASGNPPETPQI